MSGNFYDSVSGEWYDLPKGWSSSEEGNKPGDVFGPDGYKLQLVGPNGRWMIVRNGKRIGKRKYFKRASAAIRFVEEVKR